MTTHAKPRLSVSTWSLHRTLGAPASYGPEHDGQLIPAAKTDGGLPLVDLPARLAEFGIQTLEICHFHLPSREPVYLAQLRATLEEANVELWSLLIDSGDITDPAHCARDLKWIEGWVDVASQLGAKNARVIAGKSEPSPAAIQLSNQGLTHLVAYAQTRNVRIMTENWLQLASNPAVVLELLDKQVGNVGLCLDFGNWHGPNKYADLTEIAPHAESCHTKASFTSPAALDRDDYVRCLELTKAEGFAGPHTLIYDGPNDDEWAGLALEREVVAPYLA